MTFGPFELLNRARNFLAKRTLEEDDLYHGTRGRAWCSLQHRLLGYSMTDFAAI